MDIAMRLIIYPAFIGKRHILLQKLIVAAKCTDPAIDDWPSPLLPIGSKMIIEILCSMTIIYDKQNRALRDFSICIQKICQLLCVDRLEAHIMHIIHYFFEIAYADLIVFFNLTLD